MRKCVRERERVCVRARRAVRNTDHREATLSMGLGVADGGRGGGRGSSHRGENGQLQEREEEKKRRDEMRMRENGSGGSGVGGCVLGWGGSWGGGTRPKGQRETARCQSQGECV